MKNPRPLLAAALFAILIIHGGMAHAQSPLTITSKAVDQHKAVFATVESVDVVMARARIGGTIRKLAIDEGVTVTAGEVVAIVEDPKLRLELVAVNARIASLRAQSKQAELDLSRATQLRKSGAGSQARLDEAQTNVDVVHKNLKAMMAERDVVTQRTTEGRVLAPTTGRVLSVNVTDGAVIMQGEPIATIAQEAYRLRMFLPERHARFLKAGGTVQVTQRGGDKNLRQGIVRQVYPQMDRGRVVADIEVDGLGDFFVGERTTVYITTGTQNTIMIPRTYLSRKYGLSFAPILQGNER